MYVTEKNEKIQKKTKSLLLMDVEP